MVVGDSPVLVDRIEAVEGSHPIPFKGRGDRGRCILDLAKEADNDTLVLTVVTGDGSALLSAPVHDVSLADLRTTRALAKAARLSTNQDS